MSKSEKRTTEKNIATAQSKKIKVQNSHNVKNVIIPPGAHNSKFQ